VTSTLTPPVSNGSPPSSAPDLSNMSSPNPPPLSESPPNDSGDPPAPQSSSPSAPPLPAPRPPAASRMDSLASSVSTRDTGLEEGYRFLTSESEESVVAREPLLYLDDGEA
jgi:hypothetical protein